MPARTAAPADLRPWQTEALRRYVAADAPDFLVTATPGAGKTRLGLAVAAHLLERREIQRVILVTPTDHLRTQWAQAAAAGGLALDPALANGDGPVRSDTAGCVVTYAQVAAAPMLHRARTGNRRTLVVLDEVHHAGDGLRWGDAVVEAFEPARRRLSMTGTPFRTSVRERIPFVTYEPDGDGLRSRADYTYGYREALADGVVRPVMFAAYSGVARWRSSAGEVVAASLTEPMTADLVAQAWRTALDARGQWVPHVLAAADARLTELRRSGMPDAGGLVLASDQASARAYAAVLARLSGRPPTVVLSDDPRASGRIEEFRRSSDPWLVAVRMVSEGVDVPRLAVGVYATSASTALFFAQAVGRFVRARRPGETATVFLPSVRPLLAHAAELEQERDHVLAAAPEPVDPLADPLPPPVPEPGGASPTEFLDAEAEFAHLIFEGTAHVGEAAGLPAADADFLGLPGLLTAEQTATVLRRREAQTRASSRAAAAGADQPGAVAASGQPAAIRTGEPGAAGTGLIGGELATPGHSGPVESPETAAALRREVNALVARVAARTGRPHAAIHADVRREHGWVPAARATVAQLQARRDYLLRLA